MKILRLSTLSLALAIAVFALGYVNPASAVKKGEVCEGENQHPSCPDPDPNSSATFTVTVFFDDFTISEGTATNVVGKIHGNRRTLESAPMNSLDLTDLPALTPCNVTLGAAAGTFNMTTARIPPSSEHFTFVTANFTNFVLGGREESLSLKFEGGAVQDETKWLPASGKSTSVTGTTLTLSVPASSGEDPCNRGINQAWKISVFGEPPMM